MQKDNENELSRLFCYFPKRNLVNLMLINKKIILFAVIVILQQFSTCLAFNTSAGVRWGYAYLDLTDAHQFWMKQSIHAGPHIDTRFSKNIGINYNLTLGFAFYDHIKSDTLIKHSVTQDSVYSNGMYAEFFIKPYYYLEKRFFTGGIGLGLGKLFWVEYGGMGYAYHGASNPEEEHDIKADAFCLLPFLFCEFLAFNWNRAGIEKKKALSFSFECAYRIGASKNSEWKIDQSGVRVLTTEKGPPYSFNGLELSCVIRYWFGPMRTGKS